MNKTIRRVVTGHDESGRSVVISDAPAPFVHKDTVLPGFRSTDVWRTFETPAPISAQSDAEPTLGPRRQLPAPSGSVLRINCFPPENEQTRPMTAAESREHFAALGNPEALALREDSRHPHMHRTETVDYAIVLAGRITMVLDAGEVDLQAGDVVVQRGTNHAWSNRTPEPCVIAFILLDGRFLAELKSKFQ